MNKQRSRSASLLPPGWSTEVIDSGEAEIISSGGGGRAGFVTVCYQLRAFCLGLSRPTRRPTTRTPNGEASPAYTGRGWREVMS